MRRRSSGPASEAGITLCVCSVILFGVALLISASLRSLDDSISLAHGYRDRQVAQQAADAALDDGAKSLLLIGDPLTADQVQGAHAMGALTGETFPHGGHLQSRELPAYVLERLSSPSSGGSTPDGVPSPEIYRITARGTGYSAQTKMTLQAEFEWRPCPTRLGDDAGSSQDGSAHRSACVPDVRQLSRRQLSSV